MIEAALVDYLLRDTALVAAVGDRVWPNDALQDTTDPYVVLRMVDLTRETTNDGVIDQRGETILFDAIALTAGQATRAADALDAALEALAAAAAARTSTRVLGSRAVLGCFPRTGRSDADPPIAAQERGLRWQQREWFLVHQLASEVGT